MNEKKIYKKLWGKNEAGIIATIVLCGHIENPTCMKKLKETRKEFRKL